MHRLTLEVVHLGNLTASLIPRLDPRRAVLAVNFQVQLMSMTNDLDSNYRTTD